MKTICVALWISAFALQAQDVIRVETREVLVDVTVTAKGDTSNLTAKDFSIWEDGKQQKITSVTQASSDRDAPVKHFVIVLDFSMLPLDRQSESENVAAGFVEAMASPDRYMAVASLGTVGATVRQNFTNAKEPLKKAVAAPVNGSPSIAGAGFAGSMATSPGAVEVRRSLTAICESLAGGSGRTSILLFTGAVAASTSEFAGLAKACNRANAALDVIAAPPSDVRPGRVSSSFPGSTGMILPSAAALAQYLADSTGGHFYQFSSRLPEELAALAREQDNTYRLAYIPPEAKEASCHELRVATRVRGAQLRARHEYCTEKAVDVVAGKIAGQALEAKAGTGNVTATMGLPWFYTGTNRASVHLAVDVIPAGMKFEKDKDGLHGQIDLVGSAVRADGGTAARFADTVEIDVPDQQHADAVVKTPYHYDHSFNIAAGDYKFQLSLGTGPNVVAKLEAPLAVAQWNGSAFTISALTLSTETHPASPEGSGGGLLLEGKGPLTAAGRVFVPATVKQFQRSAPLYFYTELYDPGAAGGVTLEYRILDAKTGEIRGDSGSGSISGYIRPGNPLIPFATRLALDKLPAGAYRLEVKAGNTPGALSVSRTIEFEWN